MVAAEDPHSEAAAGNREKFLPVTRHALMDRLTAANLWPNGDAVQARRFLRYLDYWRRHSYAVKLLDLEQTYEPFSPDSDLLKTRTFSAEERAIMQKRLVRQMADLLQQGNFTRVDPSNVHFILTKDSAYGLDLEVDLEAFEEILIYYRGATTITERRRDVRKAYMRWREGEDPRVPAHVPAVQAQALRRARARGDGGQEDRAEGGREVRAPRCAGCCR